MTTHGEKIIGRLSEFVGELREPPPARCPWCEAELDQVARDATYYACGTRWDAVIRQWLRSDDCHEFEQMRRRRAKTAKRIKKLRRENDYLRRQNAAGLRLLDIAMGVNHEP